MSRGKLHGYIVEYREKRRGKIETWPHMFKTQKAAFNMWRYTTRPWFRIVPLYRGNPKVIC